MPQCDVVIVGGGLVGAALARSLAIHKIRSIVIDNQSATALYSANLDNRGLALSYSSIKILEQLKIWPELQQFATPIKTVHVSEQGAFGFTKLEASKYGLSVLGYVVSASSLGKAIVHDLDQNEFVTVLRPVNIETCSYDSNTQLWQINVNSQIITTKLVVAADGTNSLLRNYTNTAVTTKDYQQSAIVCNITTQQPINNIAYERFTKHGVLALLPFGVKQLKCVFTVANVNLDALKQKSDLQYLEFVQNAIGAKVGKLLAVLDRKVFPIQHLVNHQLVAPGVVFIGNSANTLHPVAAQGFNLGLRDIEQLTSLLVASQNDALSSVLQQYVKLRTTDHAKTQKFTNSLVEIFAHDSSIIRNFRRFGLLATQIIPGIKQHIVAQGIGTWQ